MRARTFAIEASAWRMCVAGLILLGLLACPALAGKAISGLGVANNADRVIINVQSDSALNMSVLSSAKGRYVGFHFPCGLSAKGKRVSVHSGGVQNVRYGNFSSRPPQTRIVVNTSRFLSYSTRWAENRKSVEISVWKHGVKSFARPAPAVVSEAAKVMTKVAGSLQVASAPLVGSPLLPQIAQVAAVAVNATPTLRSDVGATRMARIAPAAAEPPADITEVAVSAASRKKVSLNFLGADINDVLKALSVQSGENIVASKDVSGSVTVSLDDVSIDEALDYVARLSGYGYAKDKDTYLVGSKDSLRALIDQGSSNPTTQVVAFNYANGEDIIALLKSQFPMVQTANSKSGAEAKTSSGGVIVLNGGDTFVSDARTLIAQVDESIKARAEQESTRVYEVNYVNPHELQRTLEALVPDARIVIAPSDGFDLIAPEAIEVGGASDGGGAKVEHSEIKKNVDDIGRIQALVICGSDIAVNRACDLAAQLDKKPPQIKIEAKVTSLTESGEKKLGLSWDWGSFTFLESFTGGDASQVGSTDSTTTSLAKGSKAFLRQPWNFGATLEALITNGDGKLLASPTLMCIEGQPGVFFVGDEVRYVTLVQVTPTGTNVTTETANVGVQLRVNADVSPDGYITLNLHPEVSTLKLTEDKTANVTLPIISRRFTDHVVRVKDGDTIVIGGLIRDDEIDEMSKVPILGDIPLLGHLFRHRTKTTGHSEVVMFIKASLVND